MSNVIRVRLYADSLGLPRKGFVSEDERYIWQLVAWLKIKYGGEVWLLDRSKPNSLISQLYEVYREDESYFEPCDILILQEGVCDCAPRPIPKWVRDIVSRFPIFLRKRIIHFIHANRANLLKAGFSFVLTEEKVFFSFYTRFLQELKGKPLKVFVLNIAPTNTEIENHSPGFKKNIDRYNSLIKRSVESTNADNIKYIDVHQIISENENLDEFIINEDGHHITKAGHKLYFESLNKNLIF